MGRANTVRDEELSGTGADGAPRASAACPLLHAAGRADARAARRAAARRVDRRRRRRRARTCRPSARTCGGQTTHRRAHGAAPRAQHRRRRAGSRRRGAGAGDRGVHAPRSRRTRACSRIDGCGGGGGSLEPLPRAAVLPRVRGRRWRSPRERAAPVRGRGAGALDARHAGARPSAGSASKTTFRALYHRELGIRSTAAASADSASTVYQSLRASSVPERRCARRARSSSAEGVRDNTRRARAIGAPAVRARASVAFRHRARGDEPPPPPASRALAGARSPGERARSLPCTRRRALGRRRRPAHAPRAPFVLLSASRPTARRRKKASWRRAARRGVARADVVAVGRAAARATCCARGKSRSGCTSPLRRPPPRCCAAAVKMRYSRLRRQLRLRRAPARGHRRAGKDVASISLPLAGCAGSRRGLLARSARSSGRRAALGRSASVPPSLIRRRRG